MMTYKEYVEYHKSKLGGWRLFLMYFSSSFPNWREAYLEYAICKIANASDLEEVHKIVNIALPDRG